MKYFNLKYDILTTFLKIYFNLYGHAPIFITLAHAWNEPQFLFPP